MVWRRCFGRTTKNDNKISENIGRLLIVSILVTSFVSRVLICWRIPNFLMLDNGFGFAYHIVFRTEDPSLFPYRSLISSYYSLPFIFLCRIFGIYTGPFVVFMAKLPTILTFMLLLVVIDKLLRINNVGNLERSIILTLISFNPLLFKWSIYYSPEVLATYLLLLSVALSIKKLTVKNSILVGFSLALSFFLKYFFAIYLSAFVVYFLVRIRKEKSSLLAVVFIFLFLFVMGYSESLYYLFREPFFTFKGFLNMNVLRLFGSLGKKINALPIYTISHVSIFEIFMIMCFACFIKIKNKRGWNVMYALSLFSFIAFFHPWFQWRIIYPTLIITYMGIVYLGHISDSVKNISIVMLLVYELLFFYVVNSHSLFLYIDPNQSYRNAIFYVVNKIKPGSSVSLETFVFGSTNFLPIKEMYLKRINVSDISVQVVNLGPNLLEYEIVNSSYLIINSFYFSNFAYPVRLVLRSNGFVPEKSFGVYTVYKREEVELPVSGFSINCSNPSDGKYFIEGGWIWDKTCFLGNRQKITKIAFGVQKNLNYTLLLGFHSLFPNNVTILVNKGIVFSGKMPKETKIIKINLPQKFLHNGVNYLEFRFSNYSTFSGPPLKVSTGYLYLTGLDKRIYCGILDNFTIITDKIERRNVSIKKFYREFFPEVFVSNALNDTYRVGNINFVWVNGSSRICFSTNHTGIYRLFIPIGIKKRDKIFVSMNSENISLRDLYPQVLNVISERINITRTENCIFLKTLKSTPFALQKPFTIALTPEAD